MKSFTRFVFAIAAAGMLGGFAFAADAANLTGTWSLDVGQSKWRDKPAPKSVELIVDHKEPSIKWSGSVVDAQESATQFSFEGAIDGKERELKEGSVTKKIAIKRLLKRRFPPRLQAPTEAAKRPS